MRGLVGVGVEESLVSYLGSVVFGLGNRVRRGGSRGRGFYRV